MAKKNKKPEVPETPKVEVLKSPELPEPISGGSRVGKSTGNHEVTETPRKIETPIEVTGTPEQRTGHEIHKLAEIDIKNYKDLTVLFTVLSNCIDNSVGKVTANHVLSRIPGYIALMNEIQRVLKPGKSLFIKVPLFPDPESVQDPTCVNMFTQNTFKYFIKSRPLYKDHGIHYNIKPFKHIVQRVEGCDLLVTLTK